MNGRSILDINIIRQSTFTCMNVCERDGESVGERESEIERKRQRA